MLEVRAPDLPADLGERLARDVYRRDFRQRDAALRNRNSWKLERRQHFEEQGSASRDALRRGEWQEALRLLEERRGDLLTYAQDDERRASVFHRVRVVEEPLTPYVQWELHTLRLRAEYGERIRVVEPTQVAVSETTGLLPELTILGGETLYHIVYTDAGVPDGAVRYTDPDIIASWESYIKGLYDSGEDLASFFERAVTPLPPPSLMTE
jgi:hypothetical protein